MNSGCRLTKFVALYLLVLGGVVAGQESQVPVLVVGVVEVGSPKYLGVQDKLPDVLPHPMTLVRTRLVEIDSNWLVRADVPSEIELELFEDLTCHAVNNGVRDYLNSVWTWIGTCKSLADYKVRIITSAAGGITATVDAPQARYGISWLRGTTHVIWENDPGKQHLVPSSE